MKALALILACLALTGCGATMQKFIDAQPKGLFDTREYNKMMGPQVICTQGAQITRCWVQK